MPGLGHAGWARSVAESRALLTCCWAERCVQVCTGKGEGTKEEREESLMAPLH